MTLPTKEIYMLRSIQDFNTYDCIILLDIQHNIFCDSLVYYLMLFLVKAYI
jgi:hypothetical protein